MDEEELVLPENKLPYPVSPGDAPFKSLERWLDIERAPVGREAVREIKSQTIRKLEMLDEMHRDLVRRANGILESAREDIRMHDIRMHAAKIRNKVYYLYCYGNAEDSEFFSILEPEEYLMADPEARFVGAFHLNDDSSWTPMPEEGSD